ncbi:MAG TPA: hypothetical protein DDY43_00345 [Synechococcales bacterium UBA10510]|nr:hypothetical protein [Synechococcales bacterium UBA10510]
MGLSNKLSPGLRPTGTGPPKPAWWLGRLSLLLALALLMVAAPIAAALNGAALFGALAASALPLLLRQRSPLPLAEAIVNRLSGRPYKGPAGLVGLQESVLLEQLAKADQKWLPNAELLANGAIRYTYRRRAGESALSIGQLRALLASPPGYRPERQAIVNLLAALKSVGIRVLVTAPRRPAAVGEWDPLLRTIFIQPQVVARGSVGFAQVLNHEAIHGAQSCRGGPWPLAAKPLGLATTMPASLAAVLQEPLYRQASALERQLEREAYANQALLHLGPELLRRYCALVLLSSIDDKYWR